MKLIICLLPFFALCAAPAAASKQPIKAPAPAWVERIAIPTPSRDRQGAPIQPLLTTIQTLHGAEGTEYYVETASLVDRPEGLQLLGNVVIPWNPDRGDLLVHKVEIIRNGKAEDVLAKGQDFTVLRRENGLEAAMLDGILTAVLQPEGLSVGDVVHVAFTIRQKPDAMGLREEHLVALFPGMKIRRSYLREIWPAAKQLRWQGRGMLAKPQVRKTALGSELIIDLQDAEAPKAPEGAPPRFGLQTALEVSGYKDWSELSALLAPAYAKAATISAEAPLQQEIRKIAAATPDPRARALAALRLVQDNIRYLALAMGDGGLVPASADQTWARKYGECKGKTATLIALLKGLGIEAEPVLVHSSLGDALPERLPQASAFDHVIVRATVGGQSYFLDGTGLGDRQLAPLVSTGFGWGLPLRSAGARLERLPLAPPALPLTETRMTYDASAGFLVEVPMKGEMILRGEAAKPLLVGLAQLGREDFLKRASEFIDMPEGDYTWDVSSDEANGAFTVTWSGKQKMDWSGVGKSLAYRFDNDTISWEPDFIRDSRDSHDAPFQLTFPVYLASTETVILPQGGKGFELSGKSLDRIVAGTHLTRTLTLENGRATARSAYRRLQPELSAAEARASLAVLKEINNDIASVRAPGGYQMSDAEKKAMLAVEPKTTEAHNARGTQFMRTGDLEKAVAEFDKAASMSPNWAVPVANRAIVHIYQREWPQAEELLRKARALDENEWSVHQGEGLLHLGRDRPAEAVKAFSRSLELGPGNVYTLLKRARAFTQLAQFDQALADVQAALDRQPEDTEALGAKAQLLARAGRETEALAAADKLVTLEPGPSTLAYRANLLKRFAKADQAARDYSAALAQAAKLSAAAPDEQKMMFMQLRLSLLADSGQAALAIKEAGEAIKRHPKDVVLLNNRCWTRATHNVELEQALSDCDQALKLAPDRPDVMDSRAFVLLRMGRFKEAVASFDKALALAPTMAASLYGRGIAKLRDGNREEGEKDLAAARRYVFDIDAVYRGYGIEP
ncbi:MAG: tetratricopeptide repeat protein [Pseudomonadota bacterium]|nr:tetratricopeptide repeat protein [Pseudomonadota bacterium]